MGLSTILDQSPLPAAAYNDLPHIDDMKSADQANFQGRVALMNVIAAHGVQDKFSVHLVHKHFDMPPGQVMVYETIARKHLPPFQISTPRDPAKCQGLRGLYFLADDAKMVAYEYTTDKLPVDVSKHDAFLAEFSETAIRHQVQRIFSLTIRNPNAPKELTEFEMPDLSSTVLVQDSSWVPNAAMSVSTDWNLSNSFGEGNKAIETATRCTVTRSNKHHEISKYEPEEQVQAGKVEVATRCTVTRSNKHHEISKYEHEEMPFLNDVSLKRGDLMINGERLLPDSEAFNIVSHARAIICGA